MQKLRTLRRNPGVSGCEGDGIDPAHFEPVGVQRVNDLRAWQACHVYKNAVYRLCAEGPLSTDWTWRRQMEEAVAGPPAHIAAGFGRLEPADFEHYLVLARSSLIESQSHLRDAVFRGHITEAVCAEHERLAEDALREVTGLMESLRAPKAVHTDRRGRERRVVSGDREPPRHRDTE